MSQYSNIIAPGMRIGWISEQQDNLAPFNVIKRAADLHSNFLFQKILHRYLIMHDLDEQDDLTRLRSLQYIPHDFIQRSASPKYGSFKATYTTINDP
jgi:DNA-binding transcriptional MocR family regulator